MELRDHADEIAERAIGVLRAAGAVIVDPADVPRAEQLEDLPGSMVVQAYEFKRALNTYLAAAGGEHPRDLAELIAFNRAHADRELHSARPARRPGHPGPGPVAVGAGERPRRRRPRPADPARAAPRADLGHRDPGQTWKEFAGLVGIADTDSHHFRRKLRRFRRQHTHPRFARRTRSTP
ncbi:hypothetical protein ABZ379_47125 [Streptomyces canus]|uniref:hypothetical protein n=1 Tax=Streptomyces canus TaxID=58343 RepID=UPI0033D1D621